LTPLLALASVSANAGQRPLSDFTSQQGAWCAVVSNGEFDCAASYYGGPDCLQGGFSNFFPQEWSDPKTGLFASIDVLDQFGEGDFGTTVDGSISESKSPGGLAKVDVTVHASNAVTRAYVYDPDFNAIPLFGHLLFEVENGAAPTLGDALLKVSFTNTAPGADLPDFFQMAFCPAPGQALQFLAIRAHASGPLREAFGVPEGTPGRLEVTETGLIGTSLIANPNSRVGLDAFPAEHVILRVTGK
jgi:hypothetical protein